MDEKKHSLLSPSGAYRWLACTPSARFEEQIPDEASSYAEEGTLAHDLAALKVFEALAANKVYGIDPKAERARIRQSPHYSTEMERLTNDYCDYVLDIPDAAYLVEHPFNFIPPDWGLPEQKGTVDLTAFTYESLYIIDFKYGAGVKVDAYENKQLLCYALGAYMKALAFGYFRIETIVLTIYQPRVGSNPASTWIIDPAYLMDWAETELRVKAPAVLGGYGDFVAGAHCGFCKARTSCRAFYDEFSEIRRIKDARIMTAKDRARVLQTGDEVAKWCKAVKDEAIKDLLANRKIRGFKLVRRAGERAYKDEALVIDALCSELDYEQVFKVNVRSITDLEKQIGKKEAARLLDGLIVKKEGSLALVSEDDAREAYSAASDYDEDDII